MPDLNLIEDEGTEQLPEGAEQSVAPASKGGGGGGMRLLVIISLSVLILAGLVYVLNSRGIIKLWGAKAPEVVQVPEDQFPTEDQYAEAEQLPVDSLGMAADTTNLGLLETAPIEEAAPAPEPAKTAPGSKLADMKGDFTVQVVAYREKSKADDIVANLEIAGYPAFIEKVAMKGGDWYTVRIGRYASREEAKDAVKTFAEQIRSNYVIDKIRTK